MTLTPGIGPTGPVWDTFERTDASVFCTSAANGGACADAAGNGWIRCAAAGVYMFTAAAYWSGVAAGQSLSVFVSAGSGSPNDDDTARSRTPATFDDSVSTTIQQVTAAEAPVWTRPLFLDGGSGNSAFVVYAIVYWSTPDRATVF